MKKLKLAAIGCGDRTKTYMSIAARFPEKYKNVAAADPIPARRKAIRDVAGNPEMLLFRDDHEILSQPKLADVMLIGTQDAYHKEPCMRAMEAGYDILLEKPIANRLDEVLELAAAAKRLNRRVLVCHVLRYSPFYRAVKEIVDSGELGDLMSISAREGVEPWHQAHSFVRGHWAAVESSSPMILAKACHDMDIIHWLVGRDCRSVSSYGSLSHFNEAAPPCEVPARCTDGCPLEADCMYNALHYIDRRRDWLGVMDGSEEAGDDEIREWLGQSPWGRCVYHCDNTAVDHQVAAMEFEGGVTATFTMTAFDEGRSIEIFGTKSRLMGGAACRDTCGDDIIVIDHAAQTRRTIKVEVGKDGGYDSHGGGDGGLVKALYNEMTKPVSSDMLSSIHASVMSHTMAFAAEHARTTGTVVDLEGFLK